MEGCRKDEGNEGEREDAKSGDGWEEGRRGKMGKKREGGNM